jgi:ABC-type transporter Mla MlaB component
MLEERWFAMTSDCAVYDDGVLRITSTADPAGLAIAGEIDESTYDGLIGALGKLTHEPAEVHVSLGGVSYCDLAGLRAIVRVTGADGGAGGNGDARRVVLHDVPPQLATVLRIVGWDSTPGLALDQPRGPGGTPGSDRRRSVAR